MRIFSNYAHLHSHNNVSKHVGHVNINETLKRIALARAVFFFVQAGRFYNKETLKDRLAS